MTDGPNQSLDTLLQLVQTVYYGRKYEGKKERQKKTKEKAEAFAKAMKNFLKQPEKNAQRDPGEKGWDCYYCGKEGHLNGIALRHLIRPWLHLLSAKDYTGRETAPQRPRSPSQDNED